MFLSLVRFNGGTIVKHASRENRPLAEYILRDLIRSRYRSDFLPIFRLNFSRIVINDRVFLANGLLFGKLAGIFTLECISMFQ